MWSPLLLADDVLRARPSVFTGGRDAPRLLRMGGLLAVFGMFYGAVMGSYGGWSGERLWQVLFSAVKVPLLFGATFALSLPSFFVLNTLAGLRADFGRVLRALAAAQCGLTIILASLAPLTVLWYISYEDYSAAILFNGVLFGGSTVLAQGLLRQCYRDLVRVQPRLRWMLRAWLVMYAFVGIQMGWVLRPFVGAPDRAPSFFRPGAWGNAYEAVWQVILQTFR
jgi:hypothetical protein